MSETIKTILTAETGKFTSDFNKAKSTIDGYHKKILGVAAALGGTAVFAGAISKFNELRNAIDDLQKGALRLDLPVEQYQRLQAVAELAGTSVDVLAKALHKSEIAAVDATRGNGLLENEFKNLGISAATFLRLDPTARVVALSKGFNGAADRATAFNSIYKILGKSAADLIPLLRDGEAGIEAISRRLQVIGQADADAIAHLNDEISLMSANLKTNLGGALVSLRPQIEGVVAGLTSAAEGLAIFLDPAMGRGKQGGAIGGAEILRQLDKLEPRIVSLKDKLQAGGWGAGMKSVSAELDRTTAAVATLKTRFAGLTEESRLYAENLREFERLRDSGLSGDALRNELQLLQEATGERVKAIAAERDLATAAAATATEMEKQKEAAVGIAKTLETLKEKVGNRIAGAQSPEVRRDLAKGQLGDILKREKAGSVEELRSRVNSAPTDEGKLAALKALDQAIDKMQTIKKATDELRAVESARQKDLLDSFDAERAGYDEQRSAREALREEKKKLMVVENEQARAREDFAASVTAVKLELAGRKDLADKLRSEIDLRGDSISLAERLGITEEEALKRLRERAKLQELVRKSLGGTDSPTGSRGGIRNLGGRGSGLDIGRPWGLNAGREWGLRGGAHPLKAGVRANIMDRRARSRESKVTSTDPNVKILTDSLRVHQELLGVFRKLGVV